jgi:hypothetical protein
VRIVGTLANAKSTFCRIYGRDKEHLLCIYEIWILSKWYNIIMTSLFGIAVSIVGEAVELLFFRLGGAALLLAAIFGAVVI